MRKSPLRATIRSIASNFRTVCLICVRRDVALGRTPRLPVGPLPCAVEAFRVAIATSAKLKGFRRRPFRTVVRDAGAGV